MNYSAAITEMSGGRHERNVKPEEVTAPTVEAMTAHRVSNRRSLTGLRQEYCTAVPNPAYDLDEQRHGPDIQQIVN